MKKGIIFDFDGVLHDSIPSTYSGTCAVFRHCKKPEPSFIDYLEEFRAPYLEFYRERGISMTSDEIYQVFNEEVKRYSPVFFSDVTNILQRLRLLDVLMGIVSGNNELMVVDKCRSHGIHGHFSHVVGGQQSKVKSIGHFVQKHNLDLEHTFYVGDFVSDMRDARAAKVKAVGITRGNPTREILFKAGAHHVIDHLVEIFDLISVH